MTGKYPVFFVLFIIVCLSCKKSSNSSTTAVTYTSATANVDSMVGKYTGTTYGDSIYITTDSTGNKQQWVHSFSIPDTVLVTAEDTASITISSKLYSITFPYGDSLTFAFVTNLQYVNSGQYGTTISSASMTDTTDVPDHMIINVEYGYNKTLHTNMLLLNR